LPKKKIVAGKHRLGNLNELAWKLSLYVLLWNAKVKPLPLVEGDFQIWQLEIFTIFVSKVVYGCQFTVD